MPVIVLLQPNIFLSWQEGVFRFSAYRIFQNPGENLVLSQNLLHQLFKRSFKNKHGDVNWHDSFEWLTQDLCVRMITVMWIVVTAANAASMLDPLPGT